MTDTTTATEQKQDAPTLTPHQQFLEMLPDDLKSAPTFRNFTGDTLNDVVGKLAKSYVSAQSLVGLDKNAVLKIPSTPEDKEGWSAVYDKLGRPKEAKEYGIDEVAKAVEFDGIDGKFVEAISAKAHEMGVPKQAMQELAKMYFEHTKSGMTASQQEAEAMAQKYVDTVKKEFGDAYEARMKKITGTLSKVGDDEFKQLAADHAYIFDHPAVVRVFDKLMQQKAEDAGHDGDKGSGSGPLTPAEARAELAAIEGDPQNMKILTNLEDPRRDSLIKRRVELMKYIK